MWFARKKYLNSVSRLNKTPVEYLLCVAKVLGLSVVNHSDESATIEVEVNSNSLASVVELLALTNDYTGSISFDEFVGGKFQMTIWFKKYPSAFLHANDLDKLRVYAALFDENSKQKGSTGAYRNQLARFRYYSKRLSDLQPSADYQHFKFKKQIQLKVALGDKEYSDVEYFNADSTDSHGTYHNLLNLFLYSQLQKQLFDYFK